MTIKIGSTVYTPNGTGRVSAISRHRWNTMYDVSGAGFSGFYSEAEVQELQGEETFQWATGKPDAASPQLPYDVRVNTNQGDPYSTTLIPGGESAHDIPLNTTASLDYFDGIYPECPRCGTTYDVTYVPDICEVCNLLLNDEEDYGNAAHLASWNDVQAKAKRLIQDGRVKILSRSSDFYRAKVSGDNGTYTTIVSADISPTEDNQEYGFSCTCPWSKTYTRDRNVDLHLENRVCAHALAVSMQMQKGATHTAGELSLYNPSRHDLVTGVVADVSPSPESYAAEPVWRVTMQDGSYYDTRRSSAGDGFPTSLAGKTISLIIRKSDGSLYSWSFPEDIDEKLRTAASDYLTEDEFQAQQRQEAEDQSYFDGFKDGKTWGMSQASGESSYARGFNDGLRAKKSAGTTIAGYDEIDEIVDGFRQTLLDHYAALGQSSAALEKIIANAHLKELKQEAKRLGIPFPELKYSAATTSEDYNDTGLGEPEHEEPIIPDYDHDYDAGELWGDNLDDYQLLPEEEIAKNLKETFGHSRLALDHDSDMESWGEDDDGTSAPVESSLNTEWRTYKSAQEMDDSSGVFGDAEDDDDLDIVAVRHSRSQAEAAGMSGAMDSKSIVAAFQQNNSWLVEGSSGADLSDFDYSGAAQAHLAKIAGRHFSPGEQAMLISEGEEVTARNLGSLDLRSTHYVGEENL